MGQVMVVFEQFITLDIRLAPVVRELGHRAYKVVGPMP
jgi:hypothetical protein